jgi:CheY-like chemotaxis protein
MSEGVTNNAISIDILLVEDNPQDAELTLRALRKRNLANHVTWAKDGAEALELIFGPSEDPTAPLACFPQLILLDLKLPKVDGHEVLRRLKSDPRTRAIPVVMLTSSREEADVERSYKMGVNSYIVKPVEFEAFVEAVTQVGMYWVLLNQPPDSRFPNGG